ncbi:MAG TPA: cysteine desulfurase-like protein [Candidatus Polarisedimenticolaceae bacterium]|nr:cysteine desulfurase-like protein [Candidatus Polarisedimenticolaceae bacterium]
MPGRFDIEAVRALYPALGRERDGKPLVYFDGPAGSQVPQRVADAVRHYLLEHNANSGGAFVTSHETDDGLAAARRAVADFIGTADADGVAFGPNMTTLTLSLARAFARTWGRDAEVLVTRMEHDANYTPWVQAARDAGATVRVVEIRRDDCTLDLDDLGDKLGPRTKLVAVGAASNAVGTINPVKRIGELAHAVGAMVFVDAVHYAPHAAIDVTDWDCDFLVCSAYKFFGPHVGVLWGKPGPMAELPVYKLRPSSNRLPDRWMTGTQNHEGIAGTLAAIDHLADLGRATGLPATDRRGALRAAFETIVAYERGLAGEMLDALATLDGVRLWGIGDRTRLGERVPTFAVTHRRLPPAEIARHLADRGIFVWDGNYYALPLTEALGVEPDGMVRIGLLHYNTSAEIDRLIDGLRVLGNPRPSS